MHNFPPSWQMPDDQQYCVDLFAGCGGLSLGLHLAGWKGLFAIEKNVTAFETLKLNLVEKRQHFAWPSWLPMQAQDVDDVLRGYSAELTHLKGSVALVAGGPPCGGFSMAGLRKEEDARNSLITSYLSFVRAVRPTVIFFENVRGFTMPFRADARKDSTYSEFMVEQLRALGYDDVRGKLVDLSRFGVPQRRTRFILVGTVFGKAGTFFDLLESERYRFLRSRGLAARNSSRAALWDLERAHGVVPSPDSPRFEAGVYRAPRNNFQRLMRAGVLDLDTPNSHRFARHRKKAERVFAKLLAEGPRNRCIAGKERKKYGLKKRSVTVIDPRQPSPTITTIPDDYIHYAEPRVMTVRECARLQSFPDCFEFAGQYTTGGKNRVLDVPRYTQVGNAVPPLFAEFAGLMLKRMIEDG